MPPCARLHCDGEYNPFIEPVPLLPPLLELSGVIIFIMITRQIILKWLEIYTHTIDQQADALNRLDAMLGDGDFGASIQRGLQEVKA